jgi:hypothetical protein
MIFGCLINNNGPAVEGVSVTRRSIRAGSVTRLGGARKMSRCKGGYGTCFCNPGTRFNRSRYPVKLLLNLIASRSVLCKNRDSLLPQPSRVSNSAFIFLSCRICPGAQCFYNFLIKEQDFLLKSLEHNFS